MSVVVWELDSGITLPLVTMGGDVVVAVIGEGAVSLPAFTVYGVVKYDKGDVTIPLFEVNGTGLTGRAGTAEIRLPAFSVRGEGGPGSYGNVELPLIETSGLGGAIPDMDGAVILPMFEVSGALYVPPLADDYEVWVVNDHTNDHVTYSNFEITGLAEFNSSHFVTLSDGVYEMTGDDDAGTTIDWKIYWVPTDGGTSKQKSTDSLFLNFRVNGDIKLVTFTDETIKRIHNKSLADSPPGMHRRRVSGTRGLRGQTWQYGVENTGDNDVTLTDIEVNLVNLRRKLK